MGISYSPDGDKEALIFIFIYILITFNTDEAMGYNRQLTKMKKSIFVIAALFAATFANAQVTLEQTIEGAQEIYFPLYHGATNRFQLFGDIFVTESESYTYDVYDAHSLSLLCHIQHDYYIEAITRNVLSTDNSVIIIGEKYNNEATDPDKKSSINLYRPDGTIFQELGSSSSCSARLWQISNGDFRLMVRKNDKQEIYSTPGKGYPTSVSSPASNKSSARKIANKGNVLVETENNTYTLTGQQVK